MKPLKPSHKENKRYLLIQGKNLRKNVFLAIKEYVGILGLSESNLNWIKVSGKQGILSIDRKSLEKVRGAFCIFPERIEVLKVSGTLTKLKK